MPDRTAAVPGLVCPAIVAHRGASAHHPENTLAAFDAAITAGADMIELDVRLTADGVPVVIHDQDVALTTDGTGLISELTMAQVTDLNAGARWQRRESVPTLREALTLLRDRAAVEIDVKNDPGEPGYDPSRQVLADEVLKLLDALRFASAIVTSENPRTVEWVRRHAPWIATGVEAEGSADLGDLLVYSAARGYAFVLPSADAVLAAGRKRDRARLAGRRARG